MEVLVTLSSFDTFQKASSTPSDDSTRVNGRIISLQFSTDGSATWLVSGRWRLDIDYDINGVIPESLKNFNVSLTMISVDGLITDRYVLSNFTTNKISYDKEKHISSFEGNLDIVTPDKKIIPINGSFTLFEREIIIITLDPSQTASYFGTTPIYGVDT
jgi:hypothetical protein